MTFSGYIYAIFNPSVNSIVKIGKTQRSPHEYAKDLSEAANVPTPFIVVYQSFFHDCDEAELFIQTKLDQYKISTNKAFFQVSITRAVDSILDAEKYLEKPLITLNDSHNFDNNNLQSESIQNSHTSENDEKTEFEMLETADNFYYGFEETVVDYEEAFRFYLKAARLGSSEAYLQLGSMCMDGEGCIKNTRQALEFFKEGIFHGNDECWAEIASAINAKGYVDKERKCWDRYFTSKNFIYYSSRKLSAIYQYVRLSINENWPIKYKEHIIQNRDETIDFISNLSDLFEKNGMNIDILNNCIETISKL